MASSKLRVSELFAGSTVNDTVPFATAPAGTSPWLSANTSCTAPPTSTDAVGV